MSISPHYPEWSEIRICKVWAAQQEVNSLLWASKASPVFIATPHHQHHHLSYLHPLSGQWWHWILTGAWTLLWAVHVRDLGCALRMRIERLTIWGGAEAVMLVLGSGCKHRLSLAERFDCAMHAKSLQSCPTLCDPMDCTPPGSSVHQILQTKVMEWVPISFSRESSQPGDRTHISYVSCIGRQILNC